jgi:hypothetical protein
VQLDPRAIAVDGIGFHPRLVALNGFWPLEVEAFTGAGLFKPIKAALPHVVPGEAEFSWNCKFPDAVTKIVIGADPQFTSARATVRISPAVDPYTGLLTPGIIDGVEIDGAVRSPRAGSNTDFARGQGFLGGLVDYPYSGASSPVTRKATYTHGLVLFPEAVKNPTVEELLTLFD